MTAALAVACPGVYPSNYAGAVEFLAPLDPDDQGVQGVDYEFDWTAWLAGNGTAVTLSTQTVTAIDGGLEVVSSALTPDARGVTAWVRVTTAAPGARERLECAIVDSDGRPQTRTGIIRVLHR